MTLVNMPICNFLKNNYKRNQERKVFWRGILKKNMFRRVGCPFSNSMLSLTGVRYSARGSSLHVPKNTQPVKDRFPPIGHDPNKPQRRLALLIDGSKVNCLSFCNTIEPAANLVGYPVLIRLFDTDLRSDWHNLVANGGSFNRVAGPPVEWFRVERFIPISMQMSADAQHIAEFRLQNKIEAICFVCNSLERTAFEQYFDNLSDTGMNQYCFDELGLGNSKLIDGRSEVGS